MIINKYKWIILSYNISNLQGAHANTKIKLRKIDTHKASSILVQVFTITFSKKCASNLFFMYILIKEKRCEGFDSISSHALHSWLSLFADVGMQTLGLPLCSCGAQLACHKRSGRGGIKLPFGIKTSHPFSTSQSMCESCCNCRDY